MNRDHPARPLVVRFGAFGDMLLIVPMLKALAARFGQPCDVVSSGPWTAPLFSRVPAAGELFQLTSRRAPYWFNRSQRDLVATLKRRPRGPVYVFEPDEKPHWLLNRAGISDDWICSLRDFPRLPGEHIAAHALRLAQQTPTALGPAVGLAIGSSPAPDMRPTLTDDDRRDCAQWLQQRGLAGVPVVLIQPGNKKTMRRGSRQRRSNIKFWSEENWGRVIAAVRTTLPASRVVICGSPAEGLLAEEIRRSAGVDGVVIATNDLPIPRLLALQSVAHSMVSVDTGPAHGAAAMGCPLVVLFARVDPQLYAPVSTTAPVTILFPDPALPDASMSAISPDTVIEAWRKLA